MELDGPAKISIFCPLNETYFPWAHVVEHLVPVGGAVLGPQTVDLRVYDLPNLPGLFVL